MMMLMTTTSPHILHPSSSVLRPQFFILCSLSPAYSFLFSLSNFLFFCPALSSQDKAFRLWLCAKTDWCWPCLSVDAARGAGSLRVGVAALVIVLTHSTDPPNSRPARQRAKVCPLNTRCKDNALCKRLRTGFTCLTS